MKYFTDELWSACGSSDKTEQEKASAEWEKRVKEYLSVFEKTKRRLPKKFLEIFIENEMFHDFNLLSLNINQTTGKNYNPQSIRLVLETPFDVRYKTREYRITCLNPVKVEVKYGDRKRFSGFGDLVDWEILPVDRKTLLYEIRFFSGATILIHFKDKNLSVEEL